MYRAVGIVKAGAVCNNLSRCYKKERKIWEKSGSLGQGSKGRTNSDNVTVVEDVHVAPH